MADLTYYEAEQQAKDLSIKHPGIGWYVSWVDGDVYKPTIFEDYSDQAFYMNGQKIEPAELEWY